jgi:hypothetical protein
VPRCLESVAKATDAASVADRDAVEKETRRDPKGKRRCRLSHPPRQCPSCRGPCAISPLELQDARPNSLPPLSRRAHSARTQNPAQGGCGEIRTLARRAVEKRPDSARRARLFFLVTPAQAGVQVSLRGWIPAFAGMTTETKTRGCPVASTGMTNKRRHIGGARVQIPLWQWDMRHLPPRRKGCTPGIGRRTMPCPQSRNHQANNASLHR